MRFSSAIALVLLASCASGGGEMTGPDAGQADASVDASLYPLDGFGAIAGDCDELDLELSSADSTLFRSEILFERLFVDGDEGLLSAGAQEVLASDNAGGSSILSEAFAFDFLSRCEAGELIKTENEIVYDTEGSITDLLVRLDGSKIGVSVTRAIAFPFDDPYPLETGRELIEGKLADILESSANVSSADAWQKQILFVLAYSPQHADVVESVYGDLAPSLRADTIVYLLVTNGSDDFIYCNGACE